MIKGILVKVDGSLAQVDFKGFEDYKAAVGGWIEVVTLRLAKVTAIVNEEGKLRGLPLNPMATVLAMALGGISSPDCIVGNMVIVGPPNANGDETSLSQNQIDRIVKVSAKAARDLGVKA